MYLGLDLGTSSLKAVIVDASLAVRAEASVALSVQRPAAGHSEQDPAAWIRACEQVFAELRPHLAEVRGIGLSGHMHGLVLLDELDAPLRACILWNDVRAATIAHAMNHQTAAQDMTGTQVFPGFTAPKLAWVRDHEPEIWAKTRAWLFPKDFLGLWLTGQRLTEPSDASGSALFEGETWRWSETLLAAFALPAHIMPGLRASDAARGPLRQSLATRFGFGPHTIVAGGAGDNAAAALGVGVVNPGQGMLSLGTSGVMLAVTDRWQPAPASAAHAFAHAVSGTYIQLGVTLSAMDSMAWLASLTGQSVPDLLALLPSRLEAPGRTQFLPYLSGERTPHNLDAAMGTFAGLGRTSGPADLAQAVLQGIAFSLADCAEALRQAGGDVQQVVTVGGGARSPLLLEMLATVLDQPLSCPGDCANAAALGAASLGVAAANGQPVSQIASAMYDQTARQILPNAALGNAYTDALEAWRSLSLAMRNMSDGAGS